MRMRNERGREEVKDRRTMVEKREEEVGGSRKKNILKNGEIDKEKRHEVGRDKGKFDIE